VARALRLTSDNLVVYFEAAVLADYLGQVKAATDQL
jgi:hypothetical protein